MATTDLTPEAVAAAVIDALKAELSGTPGEFYTLLAKHTKLAARTAIQAEVRQADGALHEIGTVPAFLLTPDTLLTVLKDGLYQWQLDRIYQVLHEHGLIRP